MRTLSHACRDLWMRVYYQYEPRIKRDSVGKDSCGMKSWCELWTEITLLKKTEILWKKVINYSNVGLYRIHGVSYKKKARIQRTLGEWQGSYRTLAHGAPTGLLIFFWESIKIKHGQHAANDMQCSYIQNRVHDPRKTSFPWGEELAVSQCCLAEPFRYSRTVNTQ